MNCNIYVIDCLFNESGTFLRRNTVVLWHIIDINNRFCYNKTIVRYSVKHDVEAHGVSILTTYFC